MTRQPPHIVIAGGGVAAVEAVAALRALAGSGPRITLLTPDAELAPRARSVALPFGLGAPAPLTFDAIRLHAPFDVRRGALARVVPEAREVVDERGRRLRYDKLIVAVGARPYAALHGAVAFAGPRDAAAVERALEDASRVAFVVPSASAWALPAYELAMMAAVERRAEITVVTPEPAPLAVFGTAASAAVAELLAERGIALRAGVEAIAVTPGELELSAGPPVGADRVIALPRWLGPAIPALPQDAHGVLPADRHGRVLADVFAAGDATTFPLTQGGLAAQQADAVAEAIAADLGRPGEPEPFTPVLRGVLMTGGAPLYLRSSTSGEGEVSRHALWSPPGKIAGRYLAPLLATARPPVLSAAPLQDYGAVR